VGEADNLLVRLGLRLGLPSSDEGRKVYGITYQNDDSPHIYFIITFQNDIVKNIVINIQPEKQEPRSSSEWSAYSPETIINRYGVPFKVNFSVDRGRPSAYFIVIYYPIDDFIIEYYSHDVGPKLSICPLTGRMDTVRIWIGKDIQNPPNEPIVLEDATSMTLDEFSKLMTGRPDKACFNLKEEAFP
jgi:hypothetical protein